MEIKFLELFFTSFRNILFILLVFLSCSIKAQEKDFSILLEPSVSIGITTETPWAYKFGISNRNIIYNEGQFLLETRFIELSHFTGYSINDNNEFEIGIRYRFEENFRENQENEIRFLQEYENSRSYSNYELTHRFRIEERFREITSFRGRYQLSMEFPLIEDKDGAVVTLETATESLWSLGKEELPELAQRVNLELGTKLRQSNFSFGLEYRFEDYTHNPESVLFIYSRFNYKL